MENMNGRKLVEAGDLCERRNGDGFFLVYNFLKVHLLKGTSLICRSTLYLFFCDYRERS